MQQVQNGEKRFGQSCTDASSFYDEVEMMLIMSWYINSQPQKKTKQTQQKYTFTTTDLHLCTI